MGKRKADTEKAKEIPTKKPHKSLPDKRFSICVPSSIISSSNAKNLCQITHIAYQVAKAATIYDVPEIIILKMPTKSQRDEISEAQANKVVKIDKKIKFNETDSDLNTAAENGDNGSLDLGDSSGANSKENLLNENNFELFENLLQYFITPPHLVKAMFKTSKYVTKFKYAETFPKLSTLPFMNNNDVFKDFKEGISVKKKSIGSKKQKYNLNVTKYVNVGEAKPLELTHEVPVNVRVTVDLRNKKVVSPLTAYGIVGNKASFGYYTRVAKQFNEIFTKSSSAGGYTSSIYVNCDNYYNTEKSPELKSDYTSTLSNKDNKNVLLVFGNPSHYQWSLSQDSSINLPEFTQVFDNSIPLLPNLRIEDAIMIALTKACNQ